MSYIQATKPEKHNGGYFYEHEIHIILNPDKPQVKVEDVRELLEDQLGLARHQYRVSFKSKRILERGQPMWPKVFQITMLVRFVEKSHALQFKLAWIY